MRRAVDGRRRTGLKGGLLAGLASATGTLTLLSHPAEAQTRPFYSVQRAQPSAGGLRPPPAAPGNGESLTRAQLERAEREDSGRGLEFLWVDAELGVERLSLQALGGDALVDGAAVADSATGLVVGAGAGLRLVFLGAGARLRIGRFGPWNLLTAGGEVSLHWPLGDFEPRVTLGGGYARLSALRPGLALEGNPSLSAGGFNVRTGAALDYFLLPLLSLGARAEAQLLSVKREAAQLAADAAPEAQIYTESHRGVGLGFSLLLQAGLHY